MSKILVQDKRSGLFEVEIHFTYGECDRLPYNALRRIRATLDELSNGGVKANARFNLATPREAEQFIETLRQFGEDGMFEHGSPTPPDILQMKNAPTETSPSASASDDDDMEVEEEEVVIE